MASNPCKDEEVTAEVKEAPPSHYLIKFESFSELSQKGIDMFESTEFEACNYKWRMIFYLKGDDSIMENDYVSAYLAIADTTSLPAGWEANVVFSFFLFNQLCDNYLVIRGQPRRFNKIKSKWGFSKFISHKALEEPSNGYLVDDSVVVGAEIFVMTKSQGVVECLSLSNAIESTKHEWKISEFSKLGVQECCSKEFTAGNYKWKISLYPKGNGCKRDKSISIFLKSVDANGFGGQKRVNVKFSLSVKGQINGAHHERDSSHWFSSALVDWGWNSFMALDELKDPKRGFLVEDCCIVEADVSVIGAVNALS